MKRTKLAARYAKALFDYTIETNKLEDVFPDVNLIDKTFDDNSELRLIINSPVVRTDKKIAIIKELFQNQVCEISLSYFILILKKGREIQIDTICNEFVKLYKLHKNIVTLDITSAEVLSEDSIDKIVNKVKSYINANIEVNQHINPTLIGGYRLAFNDYYFDASVKGHLDKLRKELIDKSYQINF